MKKTQEDRKSNQLEQFREHTEDPNEKTLLESGKTLEGEVRTKIHTDEKQKWNASAAVEARGNNSRLSRKKRTGRDSQERKINRGFLRRITEKEESESYRRQKQPITLGELEEAIQLTKKGKDSGLDNIRVEPTEWMHSRNRSWLSNTINQWWKERSERKNCTTIESQPSTRRGTQIKQATSGQSRYLVASIAVHDHD